MAIAVVTGASGYIAGWVIKKLFERGTFEEIRGTVRSLSDTSKTNDLQRLFPALKLYEADLLKEGSFDNVMAGATVVFHTASPFPPGAVADPQKELVDPALNGTMNVLRAAEKARTVRRVVLTSSLAAVAGQRAPGHVYTEDDWNLDSTLTFESYRYSKRVAEEAAWTFAKGKTWDLVVINPSAVIGPVLTPRADATSIQKLKGLLEGEFSREGTFPMCFGQIDVRDVAEAHVRAYENPDAAGRYLLTSERAYTALEVAEVLRKSGKFDKYDLPTKERAPPAYRPQYSNAKVKKELGMELIPVEQSLVEMAHSLIDVGIVKLP